MEMDGSILEHVRMSVGLTEDNSEFDVELLNHINMAIGKLNQNGVGETLIITDESATWQDLLGLGASERETIGMIPTFMSLNVKMLFDPPPPSSVEFHIRSLDELLWRLKLSHEKEG